MNDLSWMNHSAGAILGLGFWFSLGVWSATQYVARIKAGRK